MVDVVQPDGTTKQEAKTVKQTVKVKVDRLMAYRSNTDEFRRQIANGKPCGSGVFCKSSEYDVTRQANFIVVKDERAGDYAPRLMPLIRKKIWGGQKSEHDYLQTLPADTRNSVKIKDHFTIITPWDAGIKDRATLEKVVKEFIKDNNLQGIEIIYFSDLTDIDQSLVIVKPAGSNTSNVGKTYRFEHLDIEEILGIKEMPSGMKVEDWFKSKAYQDSLLAGRNLRAKEKD